MKKVTKKQVDREVQKKAEMVSISDAAEIVQKENKIKDIFKHVEKLAEYWDQVKLAISMIKDFIAGKYTKVPWRTIAMLIGVIMYVLSPIDLIPDPIPLIGWTDDCIALAGVLAFVKVDLEEYKAWKDSRKKKVKKSIALKV